MLARARSKSGATFRARIVLRYRFFECTVSREDTQGGRLILVVINTRGQAIEAISSEDTMRRAPLPRDDGFWPGKSPSALPADEAL
jgi:hypothetical protein